MENITKYESIAKNVKSDTIKEIILDTFSKLNGDNVTKIIISIVAARTICYVCKNGGNIELVDGDKKIAVYNAKNEVA